MVKVLVVGEKSQDVFVYGSVDRICPEAPVPVLKPKYTKQNDGMAGNVCANLTALSDDIEVMGLHQDNLIIKTRYVDQKSNQMIVRVDEGESMKIVPLQVDDNRLIDYCLYYDYLIISDYDKGFISDEMIMSLTKEFDFSILDTKRKLTKEIINRVDFIKLNEQEYNNNKELVESYPQKFLITMGSKGVMYYGKTYPSSDPQETIDVSGAGDTFVAAFTLKYLQTRNIDVSIEYSNIVCSNVVNKKGVALPDGKFKLSF